jgi:surfeit locus 1 family protein
LRRRLVLLVLLVLLAPGFAALGAWQIERRAWKLALIARVDARIHAAPRSPPAPAAWARVNARHDAYRRVRATGVFLQNRETLVQAVTDLGPGWWVITPLRTVAGVILVNRGFTPPERLDAASRPAGSPTGPVTITGLLRMSEPHGGFLRANDPAAGRWYSRGLGHIAPFFIDADASPNPGGYPRGGLTVVAFRNDHLVYALTWFALAGLSVIGVVLVLRSERDT